MKEEKLTQGQTTTESSVGQSPPCPSLFPSFPLILIVQYVVPHPRRSSLICLSPCPRCVSIVAKRDVPASRGCTGITEYVLKSMRLTVGEAPWKKGWWADNLDTVISWTGNEIRRSQDASGDYAVCQGVDQLRARAAVTVLIWGISCGCSSWRWTSWSAERWTKTTGPRDTKITANWFQIELSWFCVADQGELTRKSRDINPPPLGEPWES